MSDLRRRVCWVRLCHRWSAEKAGLDLLGDGLIPLSGAGCWRVFGIYSSLPSAVITNCRETARPITDCNFALGQVASEPPICAVGWQ